MGVFSGILLVKIIVQYLFRTVTCHIQITSQNSDMGWILFKECSEFVCWFH